MGTLNMDISRIKGKDSRYRSSESLESFTSAKSGNGSFDNLDKRTSGSRDSSISGSGPNISRNHSRCNSIDELDESAYDTVDFRTDGDESKPMQTGSGENESKNVSPRHNVERGKPRPQSSIELGQGDSFDSAVPHNELGYALVEKHGSKMVSVENRMDNSRGIYSLAREVPSRAGSLKIKEEYSEPKDKRPDGAPLEPGWDKPDDQGDYREPCDSLTDSTSKTADSLIEDDKEEQVYEEIDLGGGHKASIKKPRPLLRSDAETKDEFIDVGELSEEEKLYEEIPDRNPLQRSVSNPYHSIINPKSSFIDPYDTIKDLTKTDVSEDDPPALPPKPGYEPPYENSPRLHLRQKELPPIPNASPNPDQPPPVPPRNSQVLDDDLPNAEPRPPPRPPKASSNSEKSFEKKSRSSQEDTSRESVDSDEDDDFIWDEDEWSEEESVNEQNEQPQEHVDGEEEEEIYANIKVRFNMY